MEATDGVNNSKDISVGINPNEEHQLATDFLLSRDDLSPHPASLLSAYVIGIPLEDREGQFNRLASDHEAIRVKYQLPSDDLLRSDEVEYISELKRIATKRGIKILPRSAAKNALSGPMTSGSFYNDTDKTIYLGDQNSDSPNREVHDLPHELVHALQDLDSPTMPVERREYEAYVQGLNIRKLQGIADIENTAGILWGVVSISVNAYYQGEGTTNPWSKEFINSLKK
jgi:hypothetical protein